MTNDDALRTALTKLAEALPEVFGEAIRSLLAAHPAPTEPADLRLSENGWLYEQKQKCDCSPHYGCHEISCAKEPWVNLTDLPGWDEMLAAHPAPETDEVCGNCLGHGMESCAAHPAPVSDKGGEA